MLRRGINIPGLKYGETGNFLLVAGPCVVEGEKIVFEIGLSYLINFSFL
jgi:3-deoxy-D-manno-octulosonic acid (KDO) 8-phosphate synthase